MTKPIPFGKYYLLDRINVGGMAEVFRAKAFGVEGFERLVAVKRILPSIAEDTAFISMFIDEAKLAVQLSHANIAQIFDLGKVADSYFIALEYVHGKDLRALFEHARAHGETLPMNLACYAVMKLCEGLDYAHNKRDPSGRPLGLVHRDVSPQNVLISFDGEVKVIDFGIAKAAGNAGKTRTGILKGKLGYLSPEQVRGEPIDRRSDIFAVGICLYEVLTGERLFGGGSDFSSLEKVRTYETVEPRKFNADIPLELERILARALHRDAESRYSSAMDLHDDLQAFLHAQDHSFGRRELSAWMCAAFPSEAEEGGRSRRIASSGPKSADVELEASKSAEVEQETVTNDQNRDMAAANTPRPNSGSGGNKATILGMAPVGSGGAGSREGRAVPPRPPSSRTSPPAPPGRPRTVPPAPPSRTQPPAAPRSGSVPPALPTSGTLPPASGTLPPASGTLPPASGWQPGAVPAVAAHSTVGRTLPPPPPATHTPSAGLDVSASFSVQAQQSAQSPVLDMDWDDEELSTQIYDRPEGAVDFDSQPAARHIPTYIPPVTNSGVVPSGEWAPPPQSSFDGYAEAPATPQHGLSADTLPGFTEAPTPRRRASNTSLLAAVGVLAVTLVGFGLYTLTGSSEPAVLQLATVPTDARVTFDAQVVQGSASPFLIPSIEPGTAHVLEVSKEGFEPWSQSVMVTAGQRLEFTVSLQPASESAEAPPQVASNEDFDPKRTGFSIESSPPGASVYLNGDELGGVTPMRVTGLRPGRYDLRMELDGYEVPPESSVEVKANEVSALPKFVLVGEPISVSFESTPPGAKVRLLRGGEVRTLGTTPLTSPVEPGGDAWTVEMRADGYAKVSRSLELTPGEPTTRFAVELEALRAHRGTASAAHDTSSNVSAKAAAPASSAPAATGTGTLRINSRPWSEVHVDGRLVGNTPQMNIRLSAGRHKVMLVNSEFGFRKTLNVTIQAGKTETQIVTLD